MAQPAKPFPDSYRQLSEFAVRYSADGVVFARDSVPDHCYVLLSGRVVLEGNDADGNLAVLGEVHPGQLFGHVAAFDGRPTSTSARATEDVVALAVPIDRALDAFQTSPDLALELIRDLTRLAPNDVQAELPPRLMTLVPDQDESADVAEVTDELPAPEPEEEETPEDASAAGNSGYSSGTQTLKVEFDEAFFFKDSDTCPVCETTFEYLRVRTSAVRPKERESDFRVTYRSEDPSRYAMVVCPTCSYTATHDDFSDINEKERASLVAGNQERGRFDYPNLGGPRTLEETMTALKLAQMSYDKRRDNLRLKAGLLQRFAWLERERGDEAAEREWLVQARDAYERSFEQDTDISDASAMRVAYLIGDLCLRLGDAIEGAKWLETATRFPQAKDQSGLERMARDRLSDARKAAEGQQKSA